VDEAIQDAIKANNPEMNIAKDNKWNLFRWRKKPSDISKFILQVSQTTIANCIANILVHNHCV